jgi:hypothetical protein
MRTGFLESLPEISYTNAACQIRADDEECERQACHFSYISPMRSSAVPADSVMHSEARQLVFVNLFTIVGVAILLIYGVYQYLTSIALFAYWHWS